jgi:hypothetical protein
MEMTALTAAIDALREAGPGAFGDAESLCALQRQLTRLESFMIEATHEFDTWGEYGADGARTTASWSSHSFREPIGVSRRRVSRGRGLQQLPAVAEAFAQGEINASHVDALLSARTVRNDVAMARDEEVLVVQAATLPFADFSRSLSYWEQMADPDGVEEDALAQRDRRDAYLVQSISGMHLGKMTLDPLSGAIVAGEHRRIVDQLFEADWAQAKERLGYAPQMSDLARTPAQRRADAFVEMAIRSRTAPADGRRPEPLFSVFVGYETLSGRICQLASGAVISPGSLIPWLDQALIERAVFAPDGRVEVSATTRLFTGATRRAIELRDRHCRHDFCDEPLDRCQVDHIQPASEGGPTTQENGRLLCGYHNRLRNQRPPPDG